MNYCIRGHAVYVDGCKGCEKGRTNNDYRAAVAKLYKQPPPERVTEPEANMRPVRRQQQAGTPTVVPPGAGPGTHVKAMLAVMGVPACRSCAVYAAKMDAWGVEGCRERRDQIIAHLEAEASKLDWFRWVAAGVKAVAHGLPKTAEGLFDEALKRASHAPPPA